jgi:multicomponent Na+:H+ antiporter subunit D
MPTHTLTIIWLALPIIIGFSIYLFPRLDRYLALGVAIASVGYAIQAFLMPEPLTLHLIDRFGIILEADTLSAYLILTNALITAAVVIYCWQRGYNAFFYTQTIILHGSVNSVFLCADLISLYVALEVVGLVVFLLLAYPRSDRAIWTGLRYLFISNTAMLFYLVGAILVYQSSRGFAFTGLQQAPPEAIALIFVGLLTKGGVFVSGLWLPRTNAEADAPVAALMSGAVENAGIFPLLRFVSVMDDLNPIVRAVGVGAALLGVTYALAERDTKRMLACSTLSQLGWLLAAPAVAGLYALAHSLVKSTLFLLVDQLPSRNMATLRQTVVSFPLRIPLTLSSLSISGTPLLAGFGAKTLTLSHLLPWQTFAMDVAAVGTAAIYARFIFLPIGNDPQLKPAAPQPIQIGVWLSTGLLLSGIIAANWVYGDAYQWGSITKALVVIAIGWLVHGLLTQGFIPWKQVKLPPQAENLEHLIGGMSLVLITLFWVMASWVVVPVI